MKRHCIRSSLQCTGVGDGEGGGCAGCKALRESMPLQKVMKWAAFHKHREKRRWSTSINDRVVMKNLRDKLRRACQYYHKVRQTRKTANTRRVDLEEFTEKGPQGGWHETSVSR